MSSQQTLVGPNNGQSTTSSTVTVNHKHSFESLDKKRMPKGLLGNLTKYGNNKKKANVGGAFAFWKGASVKQVGMDDLSTDDMIIAVMGPTGSGKSTFINTITGGLETDVGHNLESCTSEISIVRLAVPDLACGDLILVDTPGFDDTHKSDIDILKMIAKWLKSTYMNEIVLAGLLYFHRITDNRMAGTPLRNLRMFEELCGKNAFQNVILVTTMWDEIDEKVGEAREQELRSKYWRTMLMRNSTTGRFMRTRESAFALIEPFVDAANKRTSVLLQQEMVDMSKQLPATSAGHELYSKMESLVRQRQELLDRIRNEMTLSGGDTMTLELLQLEHEKLRINLEATVNEMQELKLPLGKRLVKMTEKFLDRKFTSFKSALFGRKKLIGSSPAAKNAQVAPSHRPPPDPTSGQATGDDSPSAAKSLQIAPSHQPPPDPTSGQATGDDSPPVAKNLQFPPSHQPQSDPTQYGWRGRMVRCPVRNE